MSLFSTLKFILAHPLNRRHPVQALSRFFKWQITSRLHPYPVVYPFTPQSSLLIRKGWTGATGNLYCGLHEFEDMAFLLHFLRAADTFVDIGANIGSYTVLASGQVGARTVAVEPVPQTFRILRQNVAINDLEERVQLHNMAISGRPGSIRFTHTFDTMNHAATSDETDTIEVAANTLDFVLRGLSPQLLKIDVEGFETEVLQGAAKTLNDPGLQVIIIELNGSGQRYGFDESQIHGQLTASGFQPYTYEPFKRKLNLLPTYGAFNTIYLRNAAIVEERLLTAPKVCINGCTF